MNKESVMVIPYNVRHRPSKIIRCKKGYDVTLKGSIYQEENIQMCGNQTIEMRICDAKTDRRERQNKSTIKSWPFNFFCNNWNGTWLCGAGLQSQHSKMLEAGRLQLPAQLGSLINLARPCFKIKLGKG